MRRLQPNHRHSDEDIPQKKHSSPLHRPIVCWSSAPNLREENSPILDQRATASLTTSHRIRRVPTHERIPLEPEIIIRTADSARATSPTSSSSPQGKSPKRKSPKRKSAKGKSPKRKSPKRKSPKHRSPQKKPREQTIWEQVEAGTYTGPDSLIVLDMEAGRGSPLRLWNELWAEDRIEPQRSGLRTVFGTPLRPHYGSTARTVAKWMRRPCHRCRIHHVVVVGVFLLVMVVVLMGLALPLSYANRNTSSPPRSEQPSDTGNTFGGRVRPH